MLLNIQINNFRRMCSTLQYSTVQYSISLSGYSSSSYSILYKYINCTDSWNIFRLLLNPNTHINIYSTTWCNWCSCCWRYLLVVGGGGRWWKGPEALGTWVAFICMLIGVGWENFSHPPRKLSIWRKRKFCFQFCPMSKSIWVIWLHKRTVLLIISENHFIRAPNP